MNSFRWGKGILVLFLLLFLTSMMSGCVTGTAGPASTGPAATGTITLESVKELDDRVVILMTSNSALNYTPYRLESPLRLVVDIPDATFKDSGTEVTVGNDTVSKVAKLEVTTDGKGVARLEIYLLKDVNYFISKPSDYQIQVEIQKEVTTETPAPVTKETETTKPPAVTYPPATKIINVVADKTPDGDLVTILTDGSVENFDPFVLEDPYRLVVDIKGLVNNFPTKELAVGGADIKTIRIGTYPDKTRIVMESAVPGKINTYNVFPLDNKLMISFRKAGEMILGSIPPVKTTPPVTIEKTTPTTTPELPTTTLAPTTGMAQPAETVTTPPATLPGETPKNTESSVVPPGVEVTPTGGEPASDEKVYTGKPMTLIFSNAKVKDLVNLIAEFSNVSIVIKPEVPDDLKLSLRLKKVPWDQALDLIVSLSGLGMVQRGNVIIVTTKEKLNEEIQNEYKFKKNLEDDEPLITRQVNVVYRKNAAPSTGTTGTTTTTSSITGRTTTTGGAPVAIDIVAAIVNAKMLSTRGSIAWAPSGDMIIVTDTQSRVDKIIEMIRILDTPEKEPEVRIEARVVEINDTFSEDLGVKWVAGYSGGSTVKAAVGDLDTTDINNDSYFDATKIFPQLPLTSLNAFGGASAMIGMLDNALRLDIQLHALESLGEAQIIESPKVRVLNNKEATITVETDIPEANPTESTDANGNVTVTSTIERNTFKTELKITPTVSPDGKVTLDLSLIHESQGEPVTLTNDSGVENTYYIKLIRNLKTVVRADDRDTIVIGGLYRKENTTTTQGLPALKDIPILGWLFKTRSKDETRREMLIFITPTIVQGQDDVTISK